MEYPEEIYQVFSDDMCGSGRRHAYEVGFQAGRSEKADYIKSISSLESVLTDVEQLEGEDLPFVKSLIERTARAVRDEQADPLAGYSNLTAAISAGEPIDWEKLDGLRTKCVNKTVGTVVGMMDRNVCSSIDEAHGWWSSLMNDIYISAFYAAWSGKNGWTLWIEGDIPLIRKTADQLKVGTYFRGESGQRLYVGEEIDSSKIIRHVPKMEKSLFDPSEWVVLEEYGPFPFPDTQ